MKMKTETYFAPETVAIDIAPETVLCSSPASTIDDFEKLPGDWE